MYHATLVEGRRALRGAGAEPERLLQQGRAGGDVGTGPNSRTEHRTEHTHRTPGGRGRRGGVPGVTGLRRHPGGRCANAWVCGVGCRGEPPACGCAPSALRLRPTPNHWVHPRHPRLALHPHIHYSYSLALSAAQGARSQRAGARTIECPNAQQPSGGGGEGLDCRLRDKSTSNSRIVPIPPDEIYPTAHVRSHCKINGGLRYKARMKVTGVG